MRFFLVFLISILTSESVSAFPGNKTIKLEGDIVIKSNSVSVDYLTDEDFINAYGAFLNNKNQQNINKEYTRRVDKYNHLINELKRYDKCVAEREIDPSLCQYTPPSKMVCTSKNNCFMSSDMYTIDGSYAEIDDIKRELKKYKNLRNKNLVSMSIRKINMIPPTIIGNHIALIKFKPSPSSVKKYGIRSTDELSESMVYCEHPFLGVSSIWKRNLGLKHRISKEYPKSLRADIFKNIGKICDKYALKGFRNFKWDVERPASMKRMNAFMMNKYYLKEFEDSKFILWGE